MIRFLQQRHAAIAGLSAVATNHNVKMILEQTSDASELVLPPVAEAHKREASAARRAWNVASAHSFRDLAWVEGLVFRVLSLALGWGLGCRDFAHCGLDSVRTL